MAPTPLTPGQFNIPFCKPGQTSTTQHPCIAPATPGAAAGAAGAGIRCPSGAQLCAGSCTTGECGPNGPTDPNTIVPPVAQGAATPGAGEGAPIAPGPQAGDDFCQQCTQFQQEIEQYTKLGNTVCNLCQKQKDCGPGTFLDPQTGLCQPTNPPPPVGPGPQPTQITCGPCTRLVGTECVYDPSLCPPVAPPPPQPIVIYQPCDGQPFQVNCNIPVQPGQPILFPQTTPQPTQPTQPILVSTTEPQPGPQPILVTQPHPGPGPQPIVTPIPHPIPPPGPQPIIVTPPPPPPGPQPIVTPIPHPIPPPGPVPQPPIFSPPPPPPPVVNPYQGYLSTLPPNLATTQPGNPFAGIVGQPVVAGGGLPGTGAAGGSGKAPGQAGGLSFVYGEGGALYVRSGGSSGVPALPPGTVGGPGGIFIGGPGAPGGPVFMPRGPASLPQLPMTIRR